MAQLTAAEQQQLVENGASEQQITFFLQCVSKYGDQVPRTDILAWYRSFLYDPHKLAGHIDFTLGKNKRDAPVIVTYDLLPDGRVENLAVRGID